MVDWQFRPIRIQQSYPVHLQCYPGKSDKLKAELLVHNFALEGFLPIAKG